MTEDDYNTYMNTLQEVNEWVEYLEEAYAPCDDLTHDWQVFWKADTWAIFKCSKCETYRMMNASHIDKIFKKEK